jgi:FkbM family methyltransferase
MAGKSALPKLAGGIGELVGRLGGDLGLLARTRRQPGALALDGVRWEYADLHSFYYQARQIFIDRLYEFDTDNPAPVILDCGAHIGLASLFFARRYPGARITAFEADPTIAAKLARNMKRHIPGRVKTVRKAVWVDADGVPFVRSGDDSGHVTADGRDAAERLPSVCLRKIVGAGPVDLLKLDIEGAEFAVLESLGPVLGNVSRLIVEVHNLEGLSGGLAGLFAVLETAGMRYCLLDSHLATWLPVAEKPPFFCLPTARHIFTVFAWRA